MGVTLTSVTTAEDLDAVRALCWDYRKTLIDNDPIDLQITETFYPVPKYRALMDRLAAEHARPKGIILLARDAEGRPAGCGMSHALEPQTSEIKRVFVPETHRRRGIAAHLCTALVDQARADGFARVVLDTSTHLPAAKHLYDKLGFTRRGPYQPIPEDVLPHLLFFEKSLT
ncbi:GNAT family N-acetyltransferase [Sulfitobacter sp. JB4-11]|uniref:GNAT family N-acetyltransferase n=1 Tax=Sulfitobacter rhodophyticola TaxID=3238304 RepID=UPI0035162E3F